MRTSRRIAVSSIVFGMVFLLFSNTLYAIQPYQNANFKVFNQGNAPTGVAAFYMVFNYFQDQRAYKNRDCSASIALDQILTTKITDGSQIWNYINGGSSTATLDQMLAAAYNLSNATTCKQQYMTKIESGFTELSDTATRIARLNALMPILTKNRPVIIRMTPSSYLLSTFYIVLLGYDQANQKVWYASSRDGGFKTSATYNDFITTYFYKKDTSSKARWDGEYLYFYNPDRVNEYNGTILPGFHGRADPDHGVPTADLQSFTYDGNTRFYALNVPASYGTEKGQIARPLVVDFHGFAQDSEVQARTSGMKQLSETQNFIVVYPEGLSLANTGYVRSWNADYTGSQWYSWSNQTGVDDVTFAEKVVNDVKRQLNIDSTRVYLTGISQGGSMALRCAVERRDIFAAVGVVSTALLAPFAYDSNNNNSYAGTYTIDASNPKKSRYISVLQINSYDDDMVPYNGSTPIPSTVTAWKNSNNCTGSVVDYPIPYYMNSPTACQVCDTSNPTNVCNNNDPQIEKITTYTGCTSGVVVKSYALHSSGCDFLGQRHDLYESNWHGPALPEKKLYVSGEIWSFLSQFAKL